MSLTVTQITARVKRQFGDSTGVQIPDAAVIDWINDAMRDIAHKQDLFQVKATSATTVNVSAYAVPAGISKLFAVKYKGVALQGISMAEADSLIGNVDLSVANGFPVGTPTHYWIWANQINLYPAPDSSGATDLTVYYTRQPTAVTTGTDVPELPDEYHNRIVEYCLAQAYELDDNFEASQSKMNQFQNGVANASDNSWETQETYPYITDIGASDFEGAWY